MRNASRFGGDRGSLVTMSALAATLIFTSLVAPAARAQQAPAVSTAEAAETDKLVSLDMRDARLEQAVFMLTKSSGLQNIDIVVANEPGKTFGLVNVTMTDKPLRKVLEVLANSAGALLTYEDGIFYLRHRDSAAARAAVRPEVKAPVLENSALVEAAPAKAARKEFQMVRIPLTYLKPSDFERMLRDPGYLSAIQNFHYEAEHVKNLNTYNPPSSIYTTPQTGLPTSGQGNGVLPVSAPASQVPGGAVGSSAGNAGEGLSSAGQRGFGGQGGQFGGQGGQFGGQGGQFGGGQFGGGQGPGGAQGQGQGQGNLRGLFPDVTNIISNDATNDLLVISDSIEDVDRLRQLIKLLDVAPKQVIIKAEFVAVNLRDADSFGIDWRIQPAGNLDVNIPPEPGGISPTIVLAYASGNAVANFRASVISNTQNLLQAPIISTMNNRFASINFSQVISIPQTVNITTPTGVLTNTIQVPIQAQNGLFVTPHINGDNSITISVVPTLSTVSQQAGGSFTQTTQTLSTTRRVQNGETMVLGGFITKDTIRSERRVPVLSDLPFVGFLFRTQDRTSSGSEVLVFITPTIIEDRAQGVIGSAGQPAPTP